MTPERWQRIEQLYHAARGRPPGARDACLADACADDDTLRRQVEELLDESDPGDGFLAGPALVRAAHFLHDTDAAVLAGRSLGVYRLRTLIGAGGMGEVYLARDETLGRDVAVKILPRAFTADPDRLARFEREARMLASLNHPNICGIYGIEAADGIRFLILELVEGETLAEKLASASRSPAGGVGLPVTEALAVARQITDALEAAHDKSIIHRDLKPANIKVTPEGLVKVLDFGLAKAVGGAAPELTHVPHSAAGEQHRGAVIGTAAYMSPEQARGLAVDRRTDIWAFGCVLFEMLTGRVAFAGDTVADSIAKILEREPDWAALPDATPVAIRRLLVRCLVKDPKKRLRDIGDVRTEIDAIHEVLPGDAAVRERPQPRRRVTWLPWVATLATAAAVGIWALVQPSPLDNPLPSQGFSVLTGWPGSEGHAEISPDGKVVAFLADREGQVDLYSGQIGTGVFQNLTESIDSLDLVAIQRRIGFSDDSATLWFGGGGQKMQVPWSGGTPGPFLVEGAQTPAWSSDNRLVYFNQLQQDALWIADAAGRNAKALDVAWPAGARAPHNHNMVWSPDNRFIYFVHGVVRDWNQQTEDMDIWRVAPEGGVPERLTFLNRSITFLAMLDRDTLLFVASEADGHGSWLWSLDVSRPSIVKQWLGGAGAVPQRIQTGLEQYTSVSASRDGKRVVATRAQPTVSLWRVPILRDKEAVEADVTAVRVQTESARAPRYARDAAAPLLFYLSAQGTGDRVWGHRIVSFQVTKGADGHLAQTPAPAPDGSRVAVVITQAGRIAVMNQDGQGSQTLADGLEIQGGIDWSPDGRWIAAGGKDRDGDGLFVISADDGTARRVASGAAVDPAWAPGGELIVYSGVFAGGRAPTRIPGALLLAVRPDGTPFELPLAIAANGTRDTLQVSSGGYRFVNGTKIVYRPAPESLDFFTFDLVSGERRQITRLGNKGSLRGFDITPDGTHIVFDRVKQHSDIVLIERPNP